MTFCERNWATMSPFSWFLSVYKLVYAAVSFVFVHLHSRVFNKQREGLLSCLHSMAKNRKDPLKIVEIGSGTGINLKYYPNGSVVTCLDPNPYMFDLMRTPENGLKSVEKVLGYAEDMHMFDDNSVDAVVSIFVLCSVSDVNKCLTEVKRILKPDGTFLYMEHVVYQKRYSFMRMIQMIANPIWTLMFDGCRLTTDLAKYIDKAGFSTVSYDYFCVPYTRLSEMLIASFLVRPHLVGYAKK